MTLTYTPGATFLVSGITQDFRGANNYRANVSCDPYAQGDAQTITNWFNRDCVVGADRSQPAVRQRRPQHRRAGRRFWQLDTALSKRFALGGPARFEFRFEAFNLLNKTNFRAPNGNRSAGRVRHDHRRPTTRGSCSSDSSSCGKAACRSCCC